MSIIQAQVATCLGSPLTLAIGGVGSGRNFRGSCPEVSTGFEQSLQYAEILTARVIIFRCVGTMVIGIGAAEPADDLKSGVSAALDPTETLTPRSLTFDIYRQRRHLVPVEGDKME